MRNLPAMIARLPKKLVADFIGMAIQNWHSSVLFFLWHEKYSAGVTIKILIDRFF
jgi:hypothetical protein